jgi:hypothetical protein
MDTLTDEALCQPALTQATALISGTSRAPRYYEWQLLGRYQRGELDLDGVADALATSVNHVFYCSQATPAPSEAQLQTLLENCRAHNAAHQITGLLLYSGGRFVQLLEGPEAEVQALYERIRRDPRHARVVSLSDGPGPKRWFTDWSMAYGHVSPPAFNRVLGAAATGMPVAVPFDDPHLQTLLAAFAGPDLDEL